MPSDYFDEECRKATISSLNRLDQIRENTEPDLLREIAENTKGPLYEVASYLILIALSLLQLIVLTLILWRVW